MPTLFTRNVNAEGRTRTIATTGVRDGVGVPDAAAVGVAVTDDHGTAVAVAVGVAESGGWIVGVAETDG
jgi:hypothetical protein